MAAQVMRCVNSPNTPNKSNKPPLGCSAPQVAPDGALQLGSALAKDLGEVLQIVTGRDTELPDKVLGGSLEIAVVLGGLVFVGTAEVGV